jgi:protein SCO1
MKLRTASRWAVVTLAVVVGAILYIARGPSVFPHAASLAGTDLQRVAAPTFELTDQNGKLVSLAQLRGHPVVLTFLPAQCPDGCPLAGKIRAALSQTGAAGNGVAVLAVSTDAQEGDQAAGTASMQQAEMAGRWHSLTGSCAQLSAVWKAYGVAGAGCNGTPHGGAPPLGLYLIDKQGRERVFLDHGLTAASLANDLRILAAEA